MGHVHLIVLLFLLHLVVSMNFDNTNLNQLAEGEAVGLQIQAERRFDELLDSFEPLPAIKFSSLSIRKLAHILPFRIIKPGDQALYIFLVRQRMLKIERGDYQGRFDRDTLHTIWLQPARNQMLAIDSSLKRSKEVHGSDNCTHTYSRNQRRMTSPSSPTPSTEASRSRVDLSHCASSSNNHADGS